MTFTKIPNELFEMMPDMGDAELRVIIFVLRESVGWQRREACITFSQFQSATGLSRQGVSNGIGAAIERGILVREANGRGFCYRVSVNEVDSNSLPSRPVAENESASNSLPSRPIDAAESLPSRPLSVHGVDHDGQPSRPSEVNEVDRSTPILKKVKERTTKERKEKRVVGAGAPTPPDPESQKTDWEIWLEALCWICHAHQNTTNLTSQDFDILSAEAKRIKKLGHAQPALLKSWFTQHWQHDWRWKKDSQRPSAYQVRQLLPGYAETVAEMNGLMEAGIRHRNGAKPRPRAQPPPPSYDDPWAVAVAELAAAGQLPDGVLERAHAEAIGDLSGAQVWEILLDMRDARELDWMQDRGKELIRKTLTSLLGGRAVKVDIIVPETEAT